MLTDIFLKGMTYQFEDWLFEIFQGEYLYIEDDFAVFQFMGVCNSEVCIPLYTSLSSDYVYMLSDDVCYFKQHYAFFMKSI